MKAYDDHTLVFFHKESLATNVWNLNFPVIPKHVYEKTIAKDPLLNATPEHVELENNPVRAARTAIKSRNRGHRNRAGTPRKLLHAQRQAGPRQAVLQDGSLPDPG